MKPYEQLANEIIIMATDEYKSCLKALKKDNDNKQLRNFRIKTEQFFYSEWFNHLTNVNPTYLIKKIKEKI
jgi:hypothetical protein